MFGWLKQKSHSDTLLSDTRLTLDAVRGLPPEMRLKCVQAVGNEITTAAQEIENAPAPSNQMDDIIRRHLTRAKEFRHSALERGATNRSDPFWAAASLYESWIMAASGSVNRRQSAEIINMIDGLLNEEFERWKKDR